MSDITVTTEDAIKFLESATRNWRRLSPLSKDDIEDVRGALEFFARHRQSSTEEVERLLAVEPDLGASTPEPNLRTIVFNYYRSHFDRLEADRLTSEYFTALTGASTHDD